MAIGSPVQLARLRMSAMMQGTYLPLQYVRHLFRRMTQLVHGFLHRHRRHDERTTALWSRWASDDRKDYVRNP